MCTDLSATPPGAEFAAAATQLGIKSMMVLPVRTHRGAVGTLSIADRQHEFDSALNSRGTIGQAKGILQERFGLDAATAFEMLKRRSHETNTPLHDIAAGLLASLHNPRGYAAALPGGDHDDPGYQRERADSS